jgi:putative PIN family toxin of toxin-antitoxin system
MRVVFDTNVYVSAFVTPGGNGDRAFRAAIDGRIELAASVPILAETGTVLIDKFGWERDQAERAVRLIAAVATVVEPAHRLALLADDPDNRILECAAAAQADAIVTGDRHLLTLGHHGNTRIITLTVFLATDDCTSAGE